MNRLEEDINKSIEMITHSYRNYDSMREYNKIYQNTTENIKGYMPYLNINYGSALLPTASGDHQLETILSGITDITCFDINRIAKYFTELKFAAIRNLTREEYIYFMYEDMLNKNYFDYLKSDLADDIATYWIQLYKNCEVQYIRDNLFRKLGINMENKFIKGIDFFKYCAENFTSYLQEDNYKLLQDRLTNINIKYIESDLKDLILDKKFDLINLTNIYEYINRDIFFYGAEEFSNIIKKLVPYLTNEGKILITYLYGCDLDIIKKYKNKPLIYAKILYILQNIPAIWVYYDAYAYEHGKNSISDKLYNFRNVQLLRYMKELDIEFYELEKVGLNWWKGDKDLTLIYKK